MENNIPTLWTSHSVNSHFVNVDKLCGNWQSGKKPIICITSHKLIMSQYHNSCMCMHGAVSTHRGCKSLSSLHFIIGLYTRVWTTQLSRYSVELAQFILHHHLASDAENHANPTQLQISSAGHKMPICNQKYVTLWLLTWTDSMVSSDVIASTTLHVEHHEIISTIRLCMWHLRPCGLNPKVLCCINTLERKWHTVMVWEHVTF